ncbi:MAG: AAA family ATPase [Oligoflexia bacterium]|nr:AAA family ATPase [Oligoflexia bacterium]
MQNPILVSLFNHKGGVSKTTTTFNLGWTLANLGIKTLIVDTDPQCNLTAYVLGLQENQSIEDFYNKKENQDIYSILEPIITGKNLHITPVKPCDTLNNNLKLVAGNFNMSDIDIQISIGLLGSELANFAKQFVGSLNAVIRETAKTNKCELVLIDMSPSSGAMNRSILMSSDYFLIPTSPDFFSYQAIQNLGNMFISWNDLFNKFRDPSAPNPLPEKPPKMLGIISQKYRTYTPRKKEIVEQIPLIGQKKLEKRAKRIASAYQIWVDKIQTTSNNTLAEKLKSKNMVIDREIFTSYISDELPYNLISIGDFNSLIAISQENQKPIFALTDEEINQSGYSLKEMQENQKDFKNLFDKLAKSICNLIKEDRSKDSLFNKLSS